MGRSRITPYGSWRSPIGATRVAAGVVGLRQPYVSGTDLYWVEVRPLEQGRSVVVRRSADGTIVDVTPPDFNARTRVHEYGGGEYLVHGSTVFFSSFADQRLYRQDPGQPPRPITPEPEQPAGARYADARLTPDGRLLLCVRERHSPGQEPVNELAALASDGSTPPTTIASGHDFFAAPRISPDGRQLAWLVWDHPRMPWDGTELWVADLEAGGMLRDPRRLAGGPQESIFQPEWSPEGTLHFVSDRTGWWNLYRIVGGAAEPLAPMEAELGVPQWQLGLATYAFLADGRIACLSIRDGFQRLGLLPPGGARVEALDLPYTSFASCLRATEDSRLLFIAASPTGAAAVVRLDLATGAAEVVRSSVEQPVEAAYVSAPRAVSYPTGDEATAHALFYPPTNPDFAAPPGERPPLLVVSHGGPTSMAHASLDLETQFWTSRGFAVVDVNYGGSTGYGRAYRERLLGRWGIVDVADCLAAARFLVDRGEADGSRLAIRGSSAGGYTTLCALTFHDTFAAGASYFGVADLERLATDTHKFESRYLDGLVGPYPAAREVYRARSPVHHAERLSCPVILLQGLDDPIVPPSQAELMVGALRERGLPVAYLAFEGEQHGFRRADSNRRSLEAELYFYSRIFRISLAEPVEPIPIDNPPPE